jgi:type VI secretion system secreted protein VgrG
MSCHASAPAYESGQNEGTFFSSTFTAIPADEPFRSPRITPKPIIQGPQTAIVVGKKGEEIDTDEFGRVRVQFHWDRYGKVDENSSCWVRVSQAAAGKSWGAVSIPRIGQEVIVEFLEGDPDQPIITGRVYNAKATVPYPLPAHKTITTFKSSTSKGGAGFNEVRFEDEKGEEQIFIYGEKNQDIRIKNDCFEWIGNNRHLVVKKDQLESVENNRHEKVKNDHCEEIGKDRNLMVKGKEAKEVTGSHSFKVTGAVIEEFGDNHSEAVSKDYYLKADNLVIEGATNVTLKVGGTSIALGADGIAIKTDGTVKIECNATLDLKSNAPMTVQSSAITTVKGSMVMIN